MCSPSLINSLSLCLILMLIRVFLHLLNKMLQGGAAFTTYETKANSVCDEVTSMSPINSSDVLLSDAVIVFVLDVVQALILIRSNSSEFGPSL